MIDRTTARRDSFRARKGTGIAQTWGTVNEGQSLDGVLKEGEIQQKGEKRKGYFSRLEWVSRLVVSEDPKGQQMPTKRAKVDNTPRCPRS